MLIFLQKNNVGSDTVVVSPQHLLQSPIFGGAVFYVKILNEYFQQILNVKFLKRGGKISYPLNEEKEVQEIDSLVDSDSPKDQVIQMVKSIMSIKKQVI